MPSLVSSWGLMLININSVVCKTIKQIGLTKYDWPKIILKVCCIYIVLNTLYLRTVDLTNKSILGMKLYSIYCTMYLIHICIQYYIVYTYITYIIYISLYCMCTIIYIIHIIIIYMYVFNQVSFSCTFWFPRILVR